MSSYNDKLWMDYVKKYEGVYPVELLSKHDGYVLRGTFCMLVPYSIDNEELLVVLDEIDDKREVAQVVRVLNQFGMFQTWTTWVLPEKNLRYVAKKLGLDTK